LDVVGSSAEHAAFAFLKLGLEVTAEPAEGALGDDPFGSVT
jgi:hypothetical protein